jgi:hypothetical protein
MSNDKVLEDLALGYAVGGQKGLGIVGTFFVVKLFVFPALFIVFCLIVSAAQMASETANAPTLERLTAMAATDTRPEVYPPYSQHKVVVGYPVDTILWMRAQCHHGVRDYCGQ